VAGQQERDDLVAQLVVVDLTRAHELGDDVLALVQLRVRPARRDLLEQQAVGLGDGGAKASPRTDALERR